MILELVTIGDELLSGYTVNTNASFIARSLADLSYHCSRQTTLPDEKIALKSGLLESFSRSDILIVTGGLGPTIDDITSDVVQSMFSQKPVLIPNQLGTAAGEIYQKDNKCMILLPGVPSEMKPMLIEGVIPYLLKSYPLTRKLHRRELHLFDVVEVSVDPLMRQLSEKHPNVKFGIYPSQGVLTVRISSDKLESIQEPFLAVETHFAAHCFNAPHGALEEAVQKIFVDHGLTLGVAESCTGGALSARITAQPAASEYFLGSIISYANSVKENVLGVSLDSLTVKGAVSEEVVREMVLGALRVIDSDFALAVTGIAGPSGGTKEKPVGTVWCAVAHKGGDVHVWKLAARGSREMVINRSVNSLLSHLLVYVKEYIL